MLQGHILLFVWLLDCEFRVTAEGKKNSEGSGCWRIDSLDQGPKVCCNRGQEILAWVMGIPLISLRKWIHVEEGKVSVGRVNRVYPSWGFTFRVISASQHHSPAQGYHCHENSILYLRTTIVTQRNMYLAAPEDLPSGLHPKHTSFFIVCDLDLVIFWC